MLGCWEGLGLLYSINCVLELGSDGWVLSNDLMGW